MWFLLPIPIFLAVAVALLALVFLGRRLFPGTYARQRAFWCPFKDKDVDVAFKEATWDGALVDVTACSAFSPAEDVRCDKGCLMLGKFPAAKSELAPAAR